VLVEEVAEMFEPQAEEKKLEIVVDYPPSTPRNFIGDSGRIRQVLINLAGNAVKFTHSGHVLLAASFEPGSDNREAVTLCVGDTGIGIPADKLKTLFQKFTQVDASTTRRYGGTGLGLAISRQLVEMMGGGISVTSAPGKGSAFSFTLPLARDGQTWTAEPLPAGLAGLRALIVDDNGINRRVVKEHVESWGIHSACYGRSLEALDEMRCAARDGRPYHFVIVDYRMPDLNGDGLASAIKSDPASSQTIIVMLTSIGSWRSCHNAEGESVDACLLKPVRPSQLLHVVASTWSKRSRNGLKALPEATRARAEKPLDLASGRVLVADDNVVNQRVVVRMLEATGIRADVAVTGKEAVEMLRIIPYDLVLMDCQMPVMSGHEAVAEFRRWQDSSRHTPVVSMTSGDQESCGQMCADCGMDDVLLKPVRQDDLVQVIRRWVPAYGTLADPVVSRAESVQATGSA
jgi:CheY-like chemotaxis protein